MDMIALPKTIRKIMTLLSERGYSAFASGAGLRELLAEREMRCFTIVTDAEPEELERLFPDGEIARGDRAFSVKLGGLAAEAKDLPVYFVQFCGCPEDYLAGRLFTADAVAFDGRELIDPYGGALDARLEVIRPVQEHSEGALAENPSAVLELVRYVAETGFCISEEWKRRIMDHGESLVLMEKDLLRPWFLDIMVCPYAGAALRCIRDCGLMPAVIGKRLWRTASKNEKKALDMFVKGVDASLPILERRLTVFYLGFLKKRDFAAMEYLELDPQLIERETFAHKHLSDLHFIKKKKHMKRVLYDLGLENYQFVENIIKLQTKIYELDNSGIFARHSMLLDIKEKREPVFLEDLAAKAEDLLSAGAVSSAERAEYVLSLLPYYVHKWPRFNTKEILIDQARKIEKNKWKELRLKHPFLRG